MAMEPPQFNTDADLQSVFRRLAERQEQLEEGNEVYVTDVYPPSSPEDFAD
jgi:hypothetical protein